MENGRRKSQMNIGEIYYWTATINGWKDLLMDDAYKDIIIDSWRNLSERGLIDVFGFVIMPTHLHAIWKMNRMNGKESPHQSFMKWTARQFMKQLDQDDRYVLPNFSVRRSNKSHEFWKRDSLAVPLFTQQVARQKLNYIHRNPISKGWNLSVDEGSYPYSSAGFYYDGWSRFDFLKDLFTALVRL